MLHGMQTFQPTPWINDLIEKKWDLVRVENLDRASEVNEQGIKPLWIIRPEDADIVDRGSIVEILNEPDIGTGWGKYTPVEYHELVMSCYPKLKDRECTIYAGSISNFSKNNLDWLAEFIPGLPPDIRISAHRYPDPDQDRTKAKKGFKTRTEELAYFKSIIGPRRFGITEFGFQHLPYKWKTCFRTKWLTYEEHARIVETEFLYWEVAGADLAVYYQIQSDPRIGDGYGARDKDGNWLPVSNIWI
jgi:hypothetical protein